MWDYFLAYFTMLSPGHQILQNCDHFVHECHLNAQFNEFIVK
jgi:hypothetical protein